MTELQVTINNLKETIIAADLFLQKLEKTQKNLEKPEVPEFPYSFIAVQDDDVSDHFAIGLRDPGGQFLKRWPELPPDFKGRACFSRGDIQEIIKGLQTLLGEQQ